MSQRLSYEGDNGLAVQSELGKGSVFYFNIENKEILDAETNPRNSSLIDLN